MAQHKLIDRFFGIVMVLLAIVYCYIAIKANSALEHTEEIGPYTFPLLIGGLLGVSGLWLAVRPNGGETWHIKQWWRLALVIAVLIVYAAVLEVIGFIPASIFCCTLLSWQIGATWQKAFIIAVIYAIGLFILFDRILDLSLPLGILGGG